jgi:hypothetical protein
LQFCCHGASDWNGEPDPLDRGDLAAWLGNGLWSFSNRHSSRRYRNRISRRQSGSGRNGRNVDAGQRHDMLDTWNFAFGNVRIDIELRRWRNGRWQRGAGHWGDTGNVGHARDGASSGRVRNVRRRLKQHGFVLYSDINAHDAGWRRSYWHSVRIYRNRQSWGQHRSTRPDGERIAHGDTESGHTRHAHRDLSIHCPVNDDKLVLVSDPRTRCNAKRLLNNFYL